MVWPMIKPTAIGGMARDELDLKLRKGIESHTDGKVYSADEIDEILTREFGKQRNGSGA